MSAPPYMKLFWGDYHKATRHLTRDQHGAYFLLIGEAWERGGILPDDDGMLAGWTRSTAPEWAALKPVVMAFFKSRRGKWVHDRVREELAVYETTSRKRKEAGRKGGSVNPEKQKGKSEAIAYQLRAKSEPEPEPDKQELSGGPEGPPEGGLFGGLPVEEAPPEPAKADKPWDRDAEFAALWLAATPQMRGRAKSKAATWPEWIKAKKAAPAAKIRAAMSVYKIHDPDVARTGGPGLHIWLKTSAFEPYLNAGDVSAPDPSLVGSRFDGPPEIRAAAVAAEGEGWAVSYLDRARWDGSTRTIIPRGATGHAKIMQSLGPDLRRLGVTLAPPETNVVPIRPGVNA